MSAGPLHDDATRSTHMRGLLRDPRTFILAGLALVAGAVIGGVVGGVWIGAAAAGAVLLIASPSGKLTPEGERARERSQP